MIQFPQCKYPFCVRLCRVVAVVLALLAVACLLTIGVAWRQLVRMQGQLQPLIQRELSRTLGRAVHIGSVQLRGLNQLVIADVRIARDGSFRDGVALKTPAAIARINLFALVLHPDAGPMNAVGHVTVLRPTASISRTREGRWDFQDIVDRCKGQSTVTHADFTLEGGRVDFADARGFGASVDPIRKEFVNVAARVSTHGDGDFTFRASGQDALDRMGPMEVAGAYSGHADAMRVNANATRIAVDELARYLPADWPITFRDGTAALRVVALIRSLPNPPVGTPLSATALTAELDLSGVGLRLRDLSAPIVATSGRLTLHYDPAKYPRGSQLQFQHVQARAGAIPITLAGQLSEINLFDLAHTRPYVNLTVTTRAGDGQQLVSLFPHTDWLRGVQLAGPTRIDAHVNGPVSDLTIDGALHSDRLTYAGVQGQGADVQFRTRLGAVTSASPTVQFAGRLRQIIAGMARLRSVSFGMTSVTPSSQLTSAPRLTGSVTATRLLLPWGETANAYSAVVISRAGLELRDVRTTAFGGVIQGQLLFPSRGGTLQADGSVHGINLQSVAAQFGLPGLRGVGNGTLSARLDAAGQWTLTSQLSGQKLAYRDYQAISATARVVATIKADTIIAQIPTLTAKTNYGNFTITNGAYRGNRQAPAMGTLHLPMHGEQIPLRAFGYDQLNGTAALDGTATGEVSHPLLVAHVDAINGALFGHHYQQAQGDISAESGRLAFHHLVFARPDVTLRIADDAQGFDPSKGIAGLKAVLEMHGAPLDDVLALFNQQSPWPVSGGVQGTLTIQPLNGQLSVSGIASIPHPTVIIPAHGPYPLQLDRLGMTFTYYDRNVQVSELDIVRGGVTLHGAGTVGMTEAGKVRADLAFTGNGVELADVPLDLFGLPETASGSATISATLDGVLHGDGPQPLTVHVSVQSPAAQVNGFPLGASAVDFAYTYRPQDQQLVIRDGTVDNPLFHASVAGHYALSQGEFDGMKVDIPRLDLAGASALLAQAEDISPLYRVLVSGLAGHGQASFVANGPARQPDVALSFGLSGLAINGASLPNLHGQIASETVAGHYRLRLHEVTADDPAGTAQARLQGTLDPINGPEVQFTARDITARVLTPWLGTLPVDGRLALTGSWRGTWMQPRAEADVQVDHPVIDGYALQQISGHLQLADNRLQLANGQVQLPHAGAPVQVAGAIPLRWTGWRPSVPADQPVALQVTLPSQTLTAFSTHFAPVPGFSGDVAGQLRVGGTLAAPRIETGWLTAAGAADIRPADPALPNQLRDLALRLNLSGDTLTIANFQATLDRQEGGKRPRSFAPGWVTAQGTVQLPTDAVQLTSPNEWRWNVYADVVRVPLPVSLTAIPNASGFLHLESENGVPVLHGVLLAEHVKVKEPKVSTSRPGLAAISFNPRLSLLLQVGEGVKVSRGLFTVSLRPTPLPRPSLPVVAGNTPPSLVIQPDQPVFAEDATQTHPGASEMPGTWGTLTGSLADPHFYARFEVGKVGFPLNLFSSIRNTKGRITYSQASGVQLVMGIHDPAPATASTTTAGSGLH